MARKKTPDAPKDFFTPERRFVVKRTGRQIAAMQKRIKMASIIALSLLILVIIIYLLFIFLSGGGSGDDYGNFTVKCDAGSRNMISLSETADFKKPTVILKGTSVNDLWHCTEDWLPKDIDKYEGAHNGSGRSEDDPSYLSYSFYVKNVMDHPITYTYDLRLVYADDLVLEASRIKIFRNGETITYGKNQDGKDKPEPEAVSLIENDEKGRLIRVDDNLIDSMSTDKYTVVIWLEGEDPECVNESNIFGKTMKLEMNLFADQDDSQ